MKNNKGRTCDFFYVSEERLAEIKNALTDYAHKEYQRACELGLDAHLTQDQYTKLVEYQIDAHIEHLKILNSAMNGMADFANNTNLAVPGSLLFKIQAFINGAMSVEFAMASQSVGMMSNVDAEDLGTCFISAIEASFSAYGKITEEKLSPFEKLVRKIDDESCPASEVVATFKAGIHDWSTNELVELCQKIPSLLNLGKILSLASPGNKRIKRMDDLTKGISILAKDEIDRRRSSN